ncbi:MAG: hypothetical protein ACRDDZ_05655 [Marinifilaceae bacterium]
MKTVSLLLYLVITLFNTVSVFANVEKTKTIAVAENAEEVQDWYLFSAIDEGELDKMAQKTKNGMFSAKITVLQALYRKYTFSTDKLNSTDATSVGAIRKPIVYAAVRNIEKHYQKQLRQKKLTDKDINNFEHVLRVAIATLDVADFGDFEVSIATDRECPVCQIEKFMQVRLQSIY